MDAYEINATKVPIESEPPVWITQLPPTPQISNEPQVTKKETILGNAVEMRALRLSTSSHSVL